MNFVVLRTATKFLLVLMLLFSIFILFRGHNKPGGGFIGGLITGIAYALYVMAHGVKNARKLVFFNLRYCLATGILCALSSGLIGIAFGKSFMTGIWLFIHIGKSSLSIGTPLIFDIGVYITVITAILMMIFSLEEKIT